MGDEVNLLPCPFCGGSDVDWTFPNDDDNDISVVCNSCTARGPETKVNWGKDEMDSSIQKAIELWNRRVPQSAHDDVKRWFDGIIKQTP